MELTFSSHDISLPGVEREGRGFYSGTHRTKGVPRHSECYIGEFLTVSGKGERNLPRGFSSPSTPDQELIWRTPNWPINVVPIVDEGRGFKVIFTAINHESSAQ